MLPNKKEKSQNIIRKIRSKTGLSQKDFAREYNIPLDTYRKWELQLRVPPAYVVDLLAFKVDNDLDKGKL